MNSQTPEIEYSPEKPPTFSVMDHLQEDNTTYQRIDTYRMQQINILGFESALNDKEFIIGMNIPPALAVVEGMAGAINTSAKESPYANPSVLFPKNFTNN